MSKTAKPDAALLQAIDALGNLRGEHQVVISEYLAGEGRIAPIIQQVASLEDDERLLLFAMLDKRYTQRATLRQRRRPRARQEGGEGAGDAA